MEKTKIYRCGDGLHPALLERMPVDPRTPGPKQPGIGREGGQHSLAFYTDLRNVMVKH